MIGPDLTGLAAKYDKAEIIRSVLEPSSRIATGFQPLVIGKRDGTVVTGLLRQEGDSLLELLDAEGQAFKVAKADVEARRVGDVSTMPTGLVDSLSPVEFADLIAYLTSLKGGQVVRSARLNGPWRGTDAQRLPGRAVSRPAIRPAGRFPSSVRQGRRPVPPPPSFLPPLSFLVFLGFLFSFLVAFLGASVRRRACWPH